MKRQENDAPADNWSPTIHQLLYGRNELPPSRTPLHVGPLTAFLEQGDLRDIRIGGVELVRRVYVAIRDENWDTIPAELSNLSVDTGEGSFSISFDATHTHQEIDYRWHGTFQSDRETGITCTMSGRAFRDFRYCRIGFCLLHPTAEYAGRPYSGKTRGGLITGELPAAIGPQRYEDCIYFPLFPAVSGLTVLLKSGIEAKFDFEGDLFEMEDQRNWTDGSFKTYCTPLALGYPHTARAGQAFNQRIRITTLGRPPKSSAASNVVALTLGHPTGRGLPRLGLGVATHNLELSSADKELLRPLRLDHLRADVHLGDSDPQVRLARAERECGDLGCGLEVALFVTDNADQELKGLSAHLPLSVPVSRVLVFHEKEQTTSREWVQRVRDRIAPYLFGVPIGGGTNLYFAELNRSRPDTSGLDVVAYSINPQVHATDERSLVENLEAQYDTLVTARTFCGELPLVVSPVTLKPRFNPDALSPEPPAPAGTLPSAVDPRQMSLFAAAWTLGSVKQLSEGGVASVTYFETTGWRGIKETNGGSPNPQLFPSAPGLVFPIYHVFADIAELKQGQILVCESADPLRVQALAIQTERGVHLLVANLTSEVQACVIQPMCGDRVQVRYLNADNAPLAMTQPRQFRCPAKPVFEEFSDSKLSLKLSPYSVVRVDPEESLGKGL